MRFVMMFVMSWIFLPSYYKYNQPVRPHVEALPTQQPEVRVWNYYWNRGRNGGYYRTERY